MDAIIAPNEFGSRIRWPKMTDMNDEEFFEFCTANPEMQIERDSRGDLLIMPPTGNESSRRENRLGRRLDEWAEEFGGYTFSSNGTFTFPDNAVRSPDGAWIDAGRWEALASEDRERFSHIAPDFVAEILSRTDSLKEAQAKMEEYISNGVRLAFLIDRFRKKAWIYRPGHTPEEVYDFTMKLSGKDVLPGFELDLNEFL